MARDISQEIAAIQAATTGNGMRSPMVDALVELNNGTLPIVSSSDNGKILYVDANGDWALGDDYVPAPTGTLNISSNGTYDVEEYASVSVSVSGEVLPSANGVSF